MNDAFDDLVDAALAEGAEPGSGKLAGGGAGRSAAFREAVMASLRAEVLPPLPFPWRRFALGAALAAGAALVAIFGLPEGPLAASADPAVWLAPLAPVVLLAPRILAAVAGEGS